ncbi:MAG: glycosyl hydrolase family 18 protein [Bacillota bacterium]|nr:glycosyl hydrolase family 18 protein [Bacillota bacterium]
MDRRWRLALGGLVALLVVVGLWSALSPRAFRRPAPFEVVGYIHDPASGLASARSHPDRLTALSPLWYSVGPDGRLVDARPDPALREFARSQGIPLVVLINNQKVGDNCQVLRSDASRRRMVSEITDLVTREGYEGINLDFQEMRPDVREEFTAVVRELARSLHAKGKILALSLIPPVDVPPEVTSVYDYRALGQAADYVVVFGYDRHNPSTDPGPIAPREWVEANIRKMVSLVPARKVVLGVGVYGYDWALPRRTPQDVTPLAVAAARELARRHGVQPQVQPGGQVTFRYAKDGRSHEVWFQDATNVKEKVDLARRYNLRGVAIWRLGFEEPAHWAQLPRRR